MAHKDIEILEFWDWFKRISSHLSKNIKDSEVLKELDKRILSLGPFDWEIGPYNNGRFFLAISPNLDKEMLHKTKEIISYANDSLIWAFLPSKPEKGWFGYWKMQNESHDDIEVNAEGWRYILYEYDDKELEIDVYIDKIDGDLNTAYQALDILLTNLLGEEKYMYLFNAVTIIRNIEEFTYNESSKLGDLRVHLEELGFY